MTLDQVRNYCLSLPGTSEDLKWEKDICFLIGEKMFFITSAEPGAGATFKVPAEEFDEISDRPGFRPAPYLARAKWVNVENLKHLRKTEGELLIKQSYELIKAKLSAKLRRSLEL